MVYGSEAATRRPSVFSSNDDRKTRFKPEHSVYSQASTSHQISKIGSHKAARPSTATRPSLNQPSGKGPLDTGHSFAAVGRGRSRALSKHGDVIQVGSTKSLTADTVKVREPRYKLWCRYLVDNRYTVTLTTLLTIYVLICDDMRILWTNRPADLMFNIMLILCIVIFGSEVILSSVGKQDYLLGFFFWLDTIATASLLLDLPWVQESMHGGDTTAEDVNNTARGRTARIGGRAARIVRIVRLIRIVKLYKVAIVALEKKIQETERRLHPGQGTTRDEEFGDDHIDPETGSRKESRVGRKLSEVTTRRVIILILAMLIVVPSLAASEGDKYPVSPFYGADEVLIAFKEVLQSKDTVAAAADRSIYETALLRLVYYHNWFSGRKACDKKGYCPSMYFNQLFWMGISGDDSDVVRNMSSQAQISAERVAAMEARATQQADVYNFGTMPTEAQALIANPWSVECQSSLQLTLGVSLLAISDPFYVDYEVKCPSDLRGTEREMFYPRLVTVNEFTSAHFVFYFDNRAYVQEQARFGMAITFFVCFALCVATMFFSSDANNLVLYPVEEMISKVERIRDDPFQAVKMSDESFKHEEKARLKLERKGWTSERLKRYLLCQSAPDSQIMETKILEKTIIKLGTLLALGFGEAGANIINQNMSSGDTAGVDVLIPGQLVDCIVGHATIQDFSVATEVLQSNVMAFVNQVAEIIHGIVDEFHGGPNRNTGDTFLVIWRANEPSWENVELDAVSHLADFAVVAFSKILGAVAEDGCLADYRGHPSLQHRLGSDFRVHVNMGLHAGWAIEGAVGSEFKIDASYISPNVAIAANIEHLCRHYNVNFMASERVVELCRPKVRERCRPVDRVRVSGSKVPLEMYSIDLDTQSVEPEMDAYWSRHFAWCPKQRFRVRQWLESEKLAKLNLDYRPGNLFEEDDTLVVMRRCYSIQFFQFFNMGYHNYMQGEWNAARHKLEQTRCMLGFVDGPSCALLQFMRETNFEAPSDWKGFRIMSSDSDVGLAGPRHSVCSSKQSRPSFGNSPTAEYAKLKLPLAADGTGGTGGTVEDFALHMLHPPEPPPHKTKKAKDPKSRGSQKGKTTGKQASKDGEFEPPIRADGQEATGASPFALPPTPDVKPPRKQKTVVEASQKPIIDEDKSGQVDKKDRKKTKRKTELEGGVAVPPSLPPPPLAAPPGGKTKDHASLDTRNKPLKGAGTKETKNQSKEDAEQRGPGVAAKSKKTKVASDTEAAAEEAPAAKEKKHGHKTRPASVLGPAEELAHSPPKGPKGKSTKNTVPTGLDREDPDVVAADNHKDLSSI